MIEQEGFADLWRQGAGALRRRDPVLRMLIDRSPGERLRPHGDVFRTLVRAIVGQQISVAASESIWRRLLETAGTIDPAAITRAGPEAIRACGLTRNKTRFIRSAAARAPLRDHATTRRRLLELDGVGPWTADMVMIFALGDLDVLPVADIGLQRAVARFYGTCRSAASVEAKGESWRPWRTVATWYLWRELDPVPVAY